MKKKNTTKTKLVATIVSMVSALALIAVGVMASLTNFQVAIANQLNLKFDAVEGTLYATRVGDVAGTDRTTSKVLSESTTATDWLKVYDGTTTEGVQNDALTSIQEKVDFVSNDKIKEKVNAGSTSIAITYYFYYTLPTDAVANNITLTAPAVADSNVAITYAYVKTASTALPTFTAATAIADGVAVTVSGGEHLFIKAEARVDLSKSVKIENADWSFALNFGISTYGLNGQMLSFDSVAGAETYEVWAKQSTASGTSLLVQTSAVGDTDSTLGTLVKVLGKTTTIVDLEDALYSCASGKYVVSVVPKTASGEQISASIVNVEYNHSYAPVKVTEKAIGGNYYYYITMGEYPQTLVEDNSLLSSLNALGDTAKTGKTYTIGTSGDTKQALYAEFTFNGDKYVKVVSAVVRDADSVFACGTAPISGSAYWFKVEPIKWFLLENYSLTKTAYTGSLTNLRVISEKILTAGIKYSSSGNTWTASNVRNWLNDKFYSEAFNTNEKSKILDNTTRYNVTDEAETKDDYTATSGSSVVDKVWLLSYYEIKHTYVASNLYLNKTAGVARPVDFAVVNNLCMGEGIGWYWLRSAGFDAGDAIAVANDGVPYGEKIAANDEGIRPSLTISL